ARAGETCVLALLQVSSRLAAGWRLDGAWTQRSGEEPLRRRREPWPRGTAGSARCSAASSGRSGSWFVRLTGSFRCARGASDGARCLLQVRVCSRAWQLLGFQEPHAVTSASGPPRPSRRKRLHRVTRALLSVLPRWVQSALGFPGPASIGVSLSPEIRSSPTKPHGKGSKRKQDDLDDEEEEEHPSWVETLSQELADDDGPAEDPDYEPSSVETDTEEYASHNNTESDLEAPGGGVLIRDVQTTRPLCNRPGLVLLGAALFSYFDGNLAGIEVF
uniref:Oogenesis-related gene n=1 Tax=Oryzias melastigma TaxID=30732 RepID=A0A3B3D224_ORYME